MSTPTYADGAACCATCRAEVYHCVAGIYLSRSVSWDHHDPRVCELTAENRRLRQMGDALASAFEEGIAVVTGMLAAVDEAHSVLHALEADVETYAKSLQARGQASRAHEARYPVRALERAHEALHRAATGQPRGESVPAERAPRPPEELVGAIHDRVHRESSKLRAAFPLPPRGEEHVSPTAEEFAESETTARPSQDSYEGGQ